MIIMPAVLSSFSLNTDVTVINIPMKLAGHWLDMSLMPETSSNKMYLLVD